MRWRAKQRGDQRTRRFFAWLPVELDDGTVVWLERVRVDEEFEFCGRRGWRPVSRQLAEPVK